MLVPLPPPQAAAPAEPGRLDPEVSAAPQQAAAKASEPSVPAAAAPHAQPEQEQQGRQAECAAQQQPPLRNAGDDAGEQLRARVVELGASLGKAKAALAESAQQASHLRARAEAAEAKHAELTAARDESVARHADLAAELAAAQDACVEAAAARNGAVEVGYFQAAAITITNLPFFWVLGCPTDKHLTIEVGALLLALLCLEATKYLAKLRW